jgi:hypothetical protein
MHHLTDLETSKARSMNKSLHSLATLLCLLTILLGTVTCVHAKQAAQSSCSHCPKRAPVSHELPSCCATQQQPPAITSATVESPAQAAPVLISLPSDKIAPLGSFLVTGSTAPPASPPRIALRI